MPVLQTYLGPIFNTAIVVSLRIVHCSAVPLTFTSKPVLQTNLTTIYFTTGVMPTGVIVGSTETGTAFTVPVLMALFTSVDLTAVIVTKPIAVLRNTICATILTVPIFPANFMSRQRMASEVSQVVFSGSTENTAAGAKPVPCAESASINRALVLAQGIISGLAEYRAVLTKPLWQTFLCSSDTVTGKMTFRVVSWRTKNIAVSSKPSHQAFSFSRSSITCIAHGVIISWFAITRWTIPAS